MSLGRAVALRRIYSTAVSHSASVPSSVNPFSPYFQRKHVEIDEDDDAPAVISKKNGAKQGTPGVAAAGAAPRRRRQLGPDIKKAYTKPLPKGIIPAYDLALKIIKEDCDTIHKEALSLEAQILALEKEPKNDENTADIDRMRVKLGILHVQSKINDPAKRWKVKNAMVNMHIPVDRHLVEQRWRDEGPLDLLMERIHQMSVVPDILPDLRPSLDLRVIYRTPVDPFMDSLPKEEREKKWQTRRNPPTKEQVDDAQKVGDHARRKVQTFIEPGMFLDSRQTQHPPKLSTKVFHVDTRLYTLLMVDYDVPNPEDQSFTSYLHWLQPNISLSATQPGYNALLSIPNNHTPYIPPHPQKGSPYHRYVILLLPQPSLDGKPYPPNGRILEKLDSKREPRPLVCGTQSQSVQLDIPAVSMKDRIGFNVREFTEKYQLDASSGGGAHMFREVWDEWVSKVIYPRCLKDTPEPIFGSPPRLDLYKETQTALSGSKYFPLKSEE